MHHILKDLPQYDVADPQEGGETALGGRQRALGGRNFGYRVYSVDIGKGIGVRGLWRKQEERKEEGRGTS